MQIKGRVIEGLTSGGIALEEDLEASVEGVAFVEVCADTTANSVGGFEKGDREGGGEGEGGGETGNSGTYDYSTGRLGERRVFAAAKGG